MIKCEDLLDDLEKFFNLRQDKVYENICNVREYRQIFTGLSNKYEQIIALLPEEKRFLLIELMDLKTDCEIIRNSRVYKQGLRDGFIVFCLLNNLRI